jgi:glutamine amidotransferase
MQVMAKKSYEGGENDCLGWFDAEVVKLNSDNLMMKVPNIGWNTVKLNSELDLFKGIPQDSDFYFVHSYHVKLENDIECIASYKYGEKVTAAILKENIFATQFHPEKSQDLGLKLLENFINWRP